MSLGLYECTITTATAEAIVMWTSAYFLFDLKPQFYWIFFITKLLAASAVLWPLGRTIKSKLRSALVHGHTNYMHSSLHILFCL